MKIFPKYDRMNFSRFLNFLSKAWKKNKHLYPWIKKNLFKINPSLLRLILIYFTWAFIFLPFAFHIVYMTPYGSDIGNNESLKLKKKKQIEHRENALEYLHSLDMPMSYLMYRKNLESDLDHLFVIIASDPQGKIQDLHTMTQLTTVLDQEIRANQGSISAAIILCNVAQKQYEELKRLSLFYPVRKPKRKFEEDEESKINIQEKYKFQFMDCLQSGLEMSRAQYITIFKDSVIPYSSFLTNLHMIVLNKLEKKPSLGDLVPKNDHWLFLHLREPSHLRHFSFNWISFQELTLVAILGFASFCAMARWFDPRWISPYSFFTKERFFFSLFGALVCLTLVISAGRPYFTELRRYFVSLYRVYDPEEAIDFTGLTLPTAGAPELLQYMEQITCSPYKPFYDILDHSIGTLERPGYTVHPSLIRVVSVW